MKDSSRVLLALVAALVLGIVVSMSGNERLASLANLVAPIGTLWVNAIRMTVIPLVVSLLITGVASAADVRAISRLSGRTLLVFFFLLAGAAIVFIPLATAVFSLLPNTARPELPPGAAAAASELAATQTPTFGAWLMTLIPTNPIGAAASGAILPLLVFTVLFAIAIAKSGTETRTTLVGFFRALSESMLVLIRWIVALAPLGIFALVFPLAAQGGVALAGAVGFYIAVYSLGCLLMIVALYPVVAVVTGIPIREFARAALPGQLIAFSTSSSLAALPALVEAAERRLGISPRVTGFALPLAASLFKFAAPVSWTVGTLFVGWFYGVPLGFGQLATIGLAAVFVAFAAPGVPRGAFLMLTPLFLAIGLPAEGIGILIAVDAIPDLFSSVLNATGNLAATALAARGEERTLPAN